MSKKQPRTLTKGCLGKVPHKSELAAKYALEAMPAKQRNILNYYKCRHCNFWHIGRTKDPFGEKGIYKT